MQRTMIWLAATALIAAPAAAQDNTADANATAATENNVVANEMAATNDLAAAPATNIDTGMAPPPEEAAPAPAPAPVKERGFPWGVIGLVGLVGLLGRRRGD